MAHLRGSPVEAPALEGWLTWITWLHHLPALVALTWPTWPTWRSPGAHLALTWLTWLTWRTWCSLGSPGSPDRPSTLHTWHSPSRPEHGVKHHNDIVSRSRIACGARSDHGSGLTKMTHSSGLPAPAVRHLGSSALGAPPKLTPPTPPLNVPAALETLTVPAAPARFDKESAAFCLAL